MPNENYRYKLLKTFWGTARQAGVNEDDARAFVQSVYPGKRLSRMTLDELDRVVCEFIKTTGIDFNMPVKKKNRKLRVQFSRDNRLELATPGQVELIDNYADALELQDFHLLSIMNRAGAKVGEPLTLKVAQNMIEGMKKMLDRGWKPKVRAEIDYQNVTWN